MDGERNDQDGLAFLRSERLTDDRKLERYRICPSGRAGAPAVVDELSDNIVQQMAASLTLKSHPVKTRESGPTYRAPGSAFLIKSIAK